MSQGQGGTRNLRTRGDKPPNLRLPLVFEDGERTRPFAGVDKGGSGLRGNRIA
jgi:hypothetical protein